MKHTPFFTLFALLLAGGCSQTRMTAVRTPVVVYQPSHQTDTGRDFSEAAVCNGIVEAAMAASTGVVQVYKVWSHEMESVHHARQGSNTVIAHTAAVDTLGKISGYAYELQESNKLHPDVFVSVHNNGGTRRHACWGFIHEGDVYEQQNRILAEELVAEICKVTDLENRGVLFDSSTGKDLGVTSINETFLLVLVLFQSIILSIKLCPPPNIKKPNGLPESTILFII